MSCEQNAADVKHAKGHRYAYLKHGWAMVEA